MATVKKGMLVKAGEWWKHLRPFGKRDFWSRQRVAALEEIRKEAAYNWSEDEGDVS